MDTEKKLEDKVVVITGASRGFGRGLSEKFASAAATVVVAARRELGASTGPTGNGAQSPSTQKIA